MSQSSNEGTENHRPAVELTDSDRHRLLSRARRRVAIDVLAAGDAPFELEELATAVVTREEDAAIVEEAAVEEAATMLHHVHLPKLDAAGVVGYDTASRRVEWSRVPASLR